MWPVFNLKAVNTEVAANSQIIKFISLEICFRDLCVISKTLTWRHCLRERSCWKQLWASEESGKACWHSRHLLPLEFSELGHRVKLSKSQWCSRKRCSRQFGFWTSSGQLILRFRWESSGVARGRWTADRKAQRQSLHWNLSPRPPTTRDSPSQALQSLV